MSLKWVHILFIALSSLLAFGFGAWSLQRGSVGMAIGSFALGAGLIAYGVWFMRKIRTQEEERRRRRKLFRSINALTGFALVWILSTRIASACSVCYGEAEGPMMDAARMGVWLLFGLTFAMQFAFATFFIVLWKRARKHRSKERKGAA